MHLFEFTGITPFQLTYPKRVAPAVPLLNVLLRLRERPALVWGRLGRQYAHLGAPTFEDGVERVFKHLCHHHANDQLQATSFNPFNFFTGHHANRTRDVRAYVINMCPDWLEWGVEKWARLTF